MRFRVQFDFCLDVDSFDEAYDLMGAMRQRVVEMAGEAATPSGETGALLDSELTPLDQVAVDSMAADDLGPGVSGAVWPVS